MALVARDFCVDQSDGDLIEEVTASQGGDRRVGLALVVEVARLEGGKAANVIGRGVGRRVIMRLVFDDQRSEIFRRACIDRERDHRGCL